MGVVYRGLQPVIKKRVAIKVLKPQVAGDELQVRRLTMEAESVNAIRHRGIIDIFGMGQLPDGRPYVVMEYLEGLPLDVWIAHQPGGRLSMVGALEVLLEMCAALAAAHRANVIHRDLKPSNVFVCMQTDGTRYLKLLDFGLAKRAIGLDGSTKQTSQATVAGTPDYMAPEQARGLPISPRSDLYALGVIAFELFTGRTPFRGDTPMDVMVAHVGAAVPSARELEPALTEGLEALIRRMLAKAPEQRPQSVDEVRAALEDAMVELGQPRPRSSREYPAYSGSASPVPQPPPVVVAPAPQAEVPVPAAPRSRLGLLVGGAVVLLGALAVVLVVQSKQTPQAVVAAVTNPAVELPPVVPVVDAGLAVAPVLAPEAVVDAGSEELVEPKVSAPTQRQLKERIATLEARARKKKNLDPTALKFLAKYKVEAAAAGTPARRVKLERALTDWERSFLKR